MNKFLVYPLIIMFVLMLFNHFYISSSQISITGENQNVNPSGEIFLNGTSTQIGIGENSIGFDLNMTLGFTALIIGVVALGTALGITALGSGLSERAQKIVFNSALWYGLWGIFSALTFTLLSSVPIFGLVLWLVFTMIYSFGFFQQIDGGNS